MPKAVIYILIIIPILILGILSGFYLLQEKLIFYPQQLSPDYTFDFEEMDASFEELDFSPEEGVKLNALLFKADSARGIVLYLHGNAGNIQSWGYAAEDYISKGLSVLIYDYRGYGKSTGRIKNEKSLHEDAAYIYKRMLEHWDESHILIHGTSLGTGIAAKLAAEYKPAVLVLETPYYSFLNVAKHHYAMLPASIILKYRLRTDKYLKNTDCPVYLFHGTSDQVIPYRSAKKLSELSKNIKLITIPKGQHNGLSTHSVYQENLKKLVNEHIKD